LKSKTEGTSGCIQVNSSRNELPNLGRRAERITRCAAIKNGECVPTQIRTEPPLASLYYRIVGNA